MALDVMSGAAADPERPPDMISPEKWPALFDIPCDKLANGKFVAISSFFKEDEHAHFPSTIFHTKDKKTFFIEQPVSRGSDPLYQVKELNDVDLKQAVFAQDSNELSIFVLTEEGVVQSAGKNENGKLGHDGTEEQSSFSKVTGLPANIQMIAAGEGHVLALTKDNQIYAWGKNGRGQLGNGEIGEEKHTPQKVFPTEGNSGEEIIHIACGSQHSVLLTKSGKVLLCGESQYGVRCEGDEGAVSTFSPVQGLEAGTYQQVCCGVRHTMALRDDGVLFCWGGNRFGQLGLGKDATKHVEMPTRVSTIEEPSDDDEPKSKKSNKDDEPKEKIIQYIRSGRVTSVAMASDGSRMVWGRWKGDTVWTPRVCADARETNDALATGSWGPETGGSVPMGDTQLFGFWRLEWLGDLPLRLFLTFARRPSDYNPWMNLLEQVAKLVKEGGDGLASRDDDGATALHYIAKFKHHSGRRGDQQAELKDKVVRTALEALAKAGAEVNARDSTGYTPLYDSISRDNDVAMNLLLSLPDVDIQSADSKGRTPLHAASKFNRMDLVPVLLEAGADIAASSKNGMRPIHQAVRKDFVDMVELLNDRASEAFPSLILRDKIKSGKTAVDLALYGECWNMIKWLLDNVPNAPMNIYNQDGTATGLHMATEADEVEVVEAFLRVHPDLLDMHDERGQTALHLSARDNTVAIAKALLREGANSESRDKQRNSALQVSITSCSIDVLKVLVDSGASTDVLTKDNETVLHLAVKTGDLEMLRVVYDYIWEQGMDDQMLVSLTKQKGDSPLHYAVAVGKIDLVLYLLTKSAPISKKNKLKRNSLHVAARNGETAIVRELLAATKKRDIMNLVMKGDRDGWTPLHHAAHDGHTETVRAIVKMYDRFTDHQDNLQWTALFYAAEHGHIGTMEVLLKANTDVRLKDLKQRSALLVAAEAGQAEAVTLLLKSGASPKTVNEHGQNVLDIAIAEKHEHVVAAIIESDAWCDALDHQTILNTGTGALITTPFRTLIRIMPDVAEKVMDKCITLSEIPQKHDDPHLQLLRRRRKWKPQMMMKFDFKYLDERLSCSGHHDHDHHHHSHGHTEEKVPASKSSSKDSVALLEQPEENAHNHSHGCQKKPRKSVVGLKPQEDKPVLEVMTNSKRTLKHPLVRALLEKKWKTTRYFVLSFLLFYTIFVLTLSMYLMLSFPADYLNATDITDHYACEKAADDIMAINDMWVVVPHQTYPIGILVIVLAVVGIILEFIQIGLMRHGLIIYLKNYSTNFLDWFAYLSAICVALPLHLCHLRMNWQWQLSVLSVMSAWLNLILFLRRLPLIGIYLLMILEMVRTLVLCLLGCLPIICTFVVAFVILHGNQTPFSNPVYSFFKIFVMMIGELDFGDQFHPDDDAEKTAMPELAYLVYLCFLVVVTTVIMNLVTGIAVTAMEAIQNEAEEQKLILQVNLTLDVECALPNFLRRLFKWNDLITELKIKDKHLQKMPLYLRNKILYGKDSGKSQSHCGSHGKDKRLTTDDVLLISHVMFPGGHSQEQDEEPPEERTQGAMELLTEKVASISEKIDRLQGENACLSTVELQMQRLEQMLNTVMQGGEAAGTSDS